MESQEEIEKRFKEIFEVIIAEVFKLIEDTNQKIHKTQWALSRINSEKLPLCISESNFYKPKTNEKIFSLRKKHITFK